MIRVFCSKLSLNDVTQGTILSLLLLNIFVNYFPLAISLCLLSQYAYDIVLLAKHRSYKMSTEMLQNDVYNAMFWFTNNGIAPRTKLVRFRSPLKNTLISMYFYLHKSNCVFLNVRLFHTRIELNILEYLSIVIYLDDSTHRLFVQNRGPSLGCCLLSKFCAPVCKQIIVHALDYSVLRYGITVFGLCSDCWRCRVDRIIKNILNNVAYNAPIVTATNIFCGLREPNFQSLLAETLVVKNF